MRSSCTSMSSARSVMESGTSFDHPAARRFSRLGLARSSAAPSSVTGEDEER